MLSSTISGDAGDGGDRVEGEAVTGVHLEARSGRRPAPRAASRSSSRARPRGIVLQRALAIGAGVQLDDVGAEPRGGLDRVRGRAR